MSGGTTYKVGLFTGTADSHDAKEIVASLSNYDPKSAQALIFDVRSETTYTLFGTAYDDDGAYGELTALTFTTQSPIPGEDTPEYRRFIGKWSMDYVNGTGAEHPQLTVTVEEEAVGNTYLVSGLLSQASREENRIDDTVRARFIDGELVLEGGTPVADAGILAARYSIRLWTYTSGNSMSQNNTDRLCGSFANDQVVFHSSSLSDFIFFGYIFYAEAMDESSRSGHIENVVPCNIVWTRLGNGQTEGFQYDTPWNPGWN